MLLTVNKNKVTEVLSAFRDEDVEATVVGNLTDNSRLKIKYHGKIVADLDMNFLFNPPKFEATAEWKKQYLTEPVLEDSEDWNEARVCLPR